MSKPFLILTLFLMSFTLHGQTYNGKKKHIHQILDNIALFSELLIARKHDELVNLYTADAKLFPSNQPILSGDALTDYWAPNPDSKITYHKVTPVEITVVKNIAYDYGRYEGTSLKADGTETNWQGKYVIVWHLIGKEWKIYLDCWNRSPVGIAVP